MTEKNINNNRADTFFESLGYDQYQKLNKQIYRSIILFVCFLVLIIGITGFSLYDYCTLSRAIKKNEQAKKNFDTVIAQKNELILQLQIYHKKTKKIFRSVEKLRSIIVLIQLFLKKYDGIRLVGFTLKNSHISVVFETENQKFNLWLEKMIDTKLFVSLAVVGITRQNTIMTVMLEGEIAQ